MKTRTILRTLAASIALAAGGASAAWPEKPIRILLPFPAGGGSDANARALGQTLSKRLGQPVVIDNRPGASGGLAAQAAMAAPADGYTILWASASMVGLPVLLKKPPYGAMTDMAPVAAVGRLPFCTFVHPSVPAKTLAEFRAEAKRNPGKLNLASGSVSELMAGTQLDTATGARMQHVPYKGGPQIMPDLVAGRVHVNIGPCSTGMPFVTSGKLRVLATLLPSRSNLLPDVPTATEAGMPELSAPTWQALVAPPRTPKEIVEKLAREVAEALKDPETLAQFGKIGVQAEFAGPAALEARIRDESPVWSRFVKQNGIEAE
jgi:tripartite-type tricarboxylate transporter receptor subunit TctC